LQYGKVAEVHVNDFRLRRKIYMIRKEIENRTRALDVFWGFIHDSANADLMRMAST
jgi:hypothetical protein